LSTEKQYYKIKTFKNQEKKLKFEFEDVKHKMQKVWLFYLLVST